MMNLDIDNPTESDLRETAAERDGHYFRGILLHGFSFSRQAAAQRLMVGNPGDLESAVLLVYLCTLSPVDIEATRTLPGRVTFYDAMGAWADAQGINLRSQAGKDVIKLADEIWAELAASEFDINPTKDQTSKDSPSPNA
jgi:hypothetical protein